MPHLLFQFQTDSRWRIQEFNPAPSSTTYTSTRVSCYRSKYKSCQLLQEQAAELLLSLLSTMTLSTLHAAVTLSTILLLLLLLLLLQLLLLLLLVRCARPLSLTTMCPLLLRPAGWLAVAVVYCVLADALLQVCKFAGLLVCWFAGLRLRSAVCAPPHDTGQILAAQRRLLLLVIDA